MVPRLSTFQPAADNDEVRSTRIPWAQVPDRVKQTLEPLTRADREALYYQQFRDGKVFYGSEYTAGGKKMWVRTDAAGKTVVNPVLAETGRPAPAVMPREASPAAGKLPVDAIGLADLPKAVQVTVLQHTNGGKAVVTTRHTEAGRTVYHTSWLDAQNDPHQMRIDEKGQLELKRLDNDWKYSWSGPGFRLCATQAETRAFFLATDHGIQHSTFDDRQVLSICTPELATRQSAVNHVRANHRHAGY